MMSIFLVVVLTLPFFVRALAGRDLPTDLAGFPPCAQKCLNDNHGDCALLDLPCMCQNQVPTIFSCMQGSCNAEDQATTLSFAQELCKQANATPTANISGASLTRATTLTTMTTTNTPNTAASPSSSATSQSSSLSTAATAGIGVGAAFGGIAVAAGGFFFWRRKRSRPLVKPPGAEAREINQVYLTSPVYDQEVTIHHEVDSAQWPELEAKAKEGTLFIR